MLLDDVTEFLQLTTDQINAHTKQLTALIQNCTDIIEQESGRKITPYTVSEYRLRPGLDFSYYGDRQIFLRGFLRDIVEITTISSRGVILTAGVDYEIDRREGLLTRLNAGWLENIVITGVFGAVVNVAKPTNENPSPEPQYEPVPAIKQVLIEMVAAKSSLWKTSFESENGMIEHLRTTTSKDTQRLLDKFKLVAI